jgi:hypothetical protein
MHATGYAAIEKAGQLEFQVCLNSIMFRPQVVGVELGNYKLGSKYGYRIRTF